MSRHAQGDGELTRRKVDYDYIDHHEDGEPGLLAVRGVPAEVCGICASCAHRPQAHPQGDRPPPVGSRL